MRLYRTEGPGAFAAETVDAAEELFLDLSVEGVSAPLVTYLTTIDLLRTSEAVRVRVTTFVGSLEAVELVAREPIRIGSQKMLERAGFGPASLRGEDRTVRSWFYEP